MIVEDSADIRNLLGYILRLKGYRPILAGHGADALRRFAGLIEKPLDPPKLFWALERFCA
jgi:CheY-like chemotaxis protein